MVIPELSSSTPLGDSRSLRLDEPKNRLTAPSHSISSHLRRTAPRLKQAMSSQTFQGPLWFGHTAWKEKYRSILGASRDGPSTLPFVPHLACFQQASCKTSWFALRGNSYWRLGSSALGCHSVVSWLRAKQGTARGLAPPHTSLSRRPVCVIHSHGHLPTPLYCSMCVLNFYWIMNNWSEW